MSKRVYFGFHYQDVIDFRANVVRNHNFTGGVEAAGYYDHSIWETAKNTNPLALKRLINSELENTSVTVILIGTDTWSRRWVRYEIMKSIERGNRVIGIHINAITGKNQQTKPLGPNPFDNLKIEVSSDGKRGRPIEWNGREWVYYSDLDTFSINEQPLANRSQQLTLSHWLPTYDWIADGGFANFSSWIQ